jgi:hypothetical protein
LFAIIFHCLTNTVSFSNFSSEFTIKPWSIAITYCDNFGWKDIDKYKKQRNRVNNLKKIAKEHFEQNLDNIQHSESQKVMHSNRRYLVCLQFFHCQFVHITIPNVIEKPTRVTEHSSTLLDPIIISDSIHYSFSDVLKVPSDTSDHDASIIFIECPKFQTRSFQREIWLFKRTDNEKFASKLDTVDWNALLSDSQDVDEMCNTFTETFLRVARECIPTKIVTIRNSDRPWFNSELRREIRKRDRIRIRFN